MVCAGLARLYAQTRRQAVGRATARGLVVVRDELAWPRDRGAMYWLTMAVASLPFDREGDAERMWSDRFEQGERWVLEHQVREPPDLGPDDVVGAVDVIAVKHDEAPYPDWRTSEDLAFLSARIREGDNSRGATIKRLAAGGMMARYLARLTFDRPACFYLRNPADAIGGVRLALWDNRLAVQPTAMTLLAITEFQEAGERAQDALSRTRQDGSTKTTHDLPKR